MGVRGRRRGIALLALAVGATGCSMPQPPVGRAHFAQHRALAVADLWDPCAGIPENILTDAGFDPGTKDHQAVSTAGKGDKGCRWTGPGGMLDAFSHTLPLRQLSGVVDFLDELTPVVIDERSATETRDPAHGTCGVGFDSIEGTVFLQITGRSPEAIDRACTQVTALTRKLRVHLPAN
ncbi:DUF3558 family protein [Nocardia sp. NPDC127579]|uniref:DUF3558 family protein n=1 Tax=Nocardia sp. NPDC127579 TaxID=3345402 RepID=UPI0036343D29